MSSENEKDQIEEEVDAITSQLLNKPGNLTKYTSAAEIAQKALSAVIAACVDNAKIIDICKIGDSFILDAVKGLYAKDKTMKKGFFNFFNFCLFLPRVGFSNLCLSCFNPMPFISISW